MSDSNVNPSRSPSPEYYDACSPKRPRFDPSNLETPRNAAVHESAQDSERIQEKFTAIYKELQKEAEKKFEKKIEELGELVQSKDRALLKLHQEKEKLREENGELVREKAELRQGKAELQQENSKLREDLAREKSVKQEALRAQATVEEKLFSLENTLDGITNIISSVRNSRSGNDTSQQGFIPEKSHFQRVNPEIITPEFRDYLEARQRHDDELEDELREANNTNSSLREASVEQQLSEQERIDDAEELQQQVEMLEDDSAGEDDIGDGFQLGDSWSEASGETDSPSHDQSGVDDAEVLQRPVEKDSAGGDDDDGDSSLPASSDRHDLRSSEHHEASREGQSSMPKNTDKPEEREKLMEMLGNDRERELDDDDEELVMQEHGEELHDDSRVLIGNKYRFFVSGPKFLTIDWHKEYRRDGNSRWVCRRCFRRLKSKQETEDHVWNVHYGGNFQCPHCTVPPTHLTRRANLLTHIRMKHC